MVIDETKMQWIVISFHCAHKDASLQVYAPNIMDSLCSLGHTARGHFIYIRIVAAVNVD